MAADTVRQPPLIVIVGPTASGKTTLAIELAKRYGGEIICADSRTIYKGMDLGTAKPTADERASVPHWGLDLVEPGQRFTAADFKAYASAKIREIRSRARVPLLVGGTGLYVDAVLFDYQFGVAATEDRAQLARLTLEELLSYCVKHNIPLPENHQNKRYVIRAIEQKSINTKRRSTPLAGTIIVGIATDKTMLEQRIKERSEHLFEHGVVEETTLLGKKYGWNNEAMTGNIYRIAHAYLAGQLTLVEAKDKFTTLDRRLAKRQMTWFRRNPYVEWLSLTEARDYVEAHLALE